MTDRKHDLEQLEKMATNLRDAATEKEVHVLVLIDSGESIIGIGNQSVPRSLLMLRNAAIMLAVPEDEKQNPA